MSYTAPTLDTYGSVDSLTEVPPDDGYGGGPPPWANNPW